MTQHVTHLLNDLIGRVSQAEHGADEGAVQRAKAKLVAYITELERKAAYHDALMVMQTEEQTSERKTERSE